MEKLIETQQKEKRLMENAFVNLKKKGDQATHGQIETRLQLLEKRWKGIENRHQEIIDLREEGDATALAAKELHSYFKTDFLEEVEEIYINEKAKFLDAAHQLSSKLTPSSSPENQCCEVTTQKPPRRKLPFIEIPHFSGKYSEWPSFKDFFTALIIDDKELTDVERLHYLKSNLCGEAASTIKSIPITAENFQRAWKKLTSFYDNERALVYACLDTLFKLPSISKESHSTLKHLRDGVTEAIEVLQMLNRPVEQMGDILVFITVQRFDPITRRDWELSLDSATTPIVWNQLDAFMKMRIQALERSEAVYGSPEPPNSKQKYSSQKQHQARISSHATSRKRSSNCSYCQGDHYIAGCDKFRSISLDKRSDFISASQLCFNCLGPHLRRDCRSNRTCNNCNGRHHTLLHQPTSNNLSNTATSLQGPTISVHATNTIASHPRHILLATAMLTVTSEFERSSTIRALIDPCSEASFISESLAQRLRLQRLSVFIPLSGVGGARSQTVRTQATVTISPHFTSDRQWKLNALVLSTLTDYLPPRQTIAADFKFTDGLVLADPQFDSLTPIEMILGADVFTQVIEEGLCKSQDGSLIAQSTSIGWILTGSWSPDKHSTKPSESSPPLTSLQCIVDQNLSSLLERFWTQEEASSNVSSLTIEETACEQHFLSTHRRNKDGRYVLRLPFKKSFCNLGDSKPSALSMLLYTEKRFKGRNDFHREYTHFMSEYETLGHMVETPHNENDDRFCFYLPHHGVFKSVGDLNPKLRVVFNGSIKLNRGEPINNCLHVGPKLQTDIFDILLRWRMYRYVFSADIRKMFRQIQIDPEDQHFQRILWRPSENQDVMAYNLTTVTYGLASSPYQAVRTLRQLAVDEGYRFPQAAKVLNENTYVDDIFAGGDTLQEADQLRVDLVDLLKAGGFPLSKWSANHYQLLMGVKEDKLASSTRTWKQFDEVQTLGISWQPTTDVFTFRLNPTIFTNTFTKRRCLSLIAQLYDPLGWIAPVIISFKLFVQTLWHESLGWDDPLPHRLQDHWEHILNGLKDLQAYSMPRWTSYSKNVQQIEIHGYSDASERAYAACVYLRVVDNQGHTRVTLLASKSKVAPIKQISLPRLELCGAVLAVRLTKRIQDSLDLKGVKCHLWTDSTITLSWIAKHPTNWKTFVANRVSEIQVSLPEACWHHVSSKDNPADLASRGISSSALVGSSLWLHGSPHLTKSSSPWSTVSHFQTLDSVPEMRTKTCLSTTIPQEESDLLTRYSSLERLIRVTARCRQFIAHLRAHTRSKHTKHSSVPLIPINQLTPQELFESLCHWIAYVQKFYFNQDLQTLSKNGCVEAKSPLIRLNPYIDDRGLLRVGGRLQHSLLHPDEAHPLILPRQSYLSKLIVIDAHIKSLHGGTQLTLNYIRQRYWILRGRQLVKAIILRCVQCWRQRSVPAGQLMGDLPSRRVRRYRPFLHSGVDFAGPINLRFSGGRGSKSFKGYVVVFVCLSTRAVHLEVSSGYSTQDFLNVYRRFVARRGICATLSSDCGTNFVGADKELRGLFQKAKSQSQHIVNSLANDGTEWRFNPPAAPHFGGIWEAAVKSVKHHLRRIIGDNVLTFEEMTTLLAQIEACLNSRPLHPLSDDSSDFTALTPGHFLIGGPLLTIPEPSVLELKTSRLSRWQLLRQMYEHFWTRWSSEYLHELQHRPKWRCRQPSVRVGDLCIVRSNQQPPCKWPLARIIDVKPGADGLVRVVQLKTASGTLLRPIGKISILPLDENCSPIVGEGGRNVPN